MNWIKNKYGNVDIFITENGFSDTGELDDVKRIEFYQVIIFQTMEYIRIFVYISEYFSDLF